ncbi:hypothetical protein CBA19CS11_20655 [Caballeronia novacaledonica]|nr:hypothetical protein CBA19CS11_20655 [Caballeronia novacaledonica]
MALTASVDELQDRAATLGMHSICNRLPARVLAIVIDACGAEIRARLRRNACGFDDYETAFGSTLAVKVGHHRARNVVGLNGAQARHRGKDDTMFEVECADFRRSEQLGHDGTFESELSTVGSGASRDALR